jgi:hypothetical protein
METNMEETASQSTSAQVAARLKQPRTLIYVAVALALGAAGAGVYWQVALKPMRAVAETRYRSHVALMRLYDMQLAFRNANGRYANDLDTLLMSAPDGAKLRDSLKASVDLNTLAVFGDAKGFRFEANVLDPARTSVKIKGPM